MSNSMSDDYFSFMSNRGTGRRTENRVPTRPAAVVPSDTIEFVAEPPTHVESPIEVLESFISDTMVQRIFRRRADRTGG